MTWRVHEPSFSARRRASPGSGSAGPVAGPGSSGSSTNGRRGTIARCFRGATTSSRSRCSPRCCTRCPCCTRRHRTLASTKISPLGSGSISASRPPSRSPADDRSASSYPPFPVPSTPVNRQSSSPIFLFLPLFLSLFFFLYQKLEEIHAIRTLFFHLCVIHTLE